MEVTASTYHIPALLTETIDLLDIKPDGIYVDATFGGGGHSREILKHLGPEGHLYGFDQDLDARQNIPDDPRFTFVHSNFRFIRNFLKFYGHLHIDGILADLGVSFHHFDTPDRGFSFRNEAPLDMRMNQKSSVSAREILADYTEQDLTALLREHTDINNPGRIARQICSARREDPIATTTQMAEIVRPLLNPNAFKKELAQVFQALRITANDEMGALKDLLSQSLTVLKPGGRFAVLTYHSGEDRLVKNFFKTGDFGKEDNQDMIYGTRKSPWKLLSKTPLTASAAEVEYNPRSRSAKLRVAQLKK